MRVYPVLDSDISNIRDAATMSGIAFSIAWAFVGAVVSILVNAAFMTQPTPYAQVAVYFVAPAFALIAAVFLIFGAMQAKHQTDTWKRIRSETKPQSISASAQ
jgi:phosphate/sulfate permease